MMRSLIKTGVAALALLGGSMSVSAAQIDFTDGAYSSLNGNQTGTIGGITFSSYRYFFDGLGQVLNGSLITGDPSHVELTSTNNGLGVNSIPSNLVEGLGELLIDDNDQVDGHEFLVLAFDQPATVNGVFLNGLNLLESASAYIIDDGFPNFGLNLNTELLGIDNLLNALTPDNFDFNTNYWDLGGEDNVSYLILSGVLLSDFSLAGIDYMTSGGPGYPNPVPEPASLLLLTTGLGLLGWRTRRKGAGQQEPLLA